MNQFSEEEESFVESDIVLTTAAYPGSEPCRRRIGTGVLGTIFLMVNATLGAGLLNFPEAFDKSGGIATALIAQLFFLVFITLTLVILASSSDVTNTTTLQSTFAGLCGQNSLVFCGLCVAIYSFGCCVTFLVVIGDQFDRVFATYFGLDYCHTWYLSRSFITCLTSVLFILPLSFFKRLDALNYASSIGCLTIIYVVWLIVYESFDHHKLPSKPVRIWPENFTQVLQIVPIICFAYQSHMTAIPTYACMKSREIGKFTLCSIISMIICFFGYSIVGVFGYATFGIGKVPSDILQGYSDKSTTLTIAIIAIAIKNFTTFPIVLYCGRDAILSIFNRDVNCNFWIRFTITIIWFILSLIIAILVPDIAPIINIMGSLSAAFIFVFPGICLFQYILQKDPQLYLIKDRCLIVLSIFITALGAFVCGVIFVEALQDFQKVPEKPPLITGFKAQLGASLCS
ncbi:putative sodium-coupled neutral amino acid transporter 7 [Trichogramma pretiosum]|uniref:Amino acid transporter transmembrane domain-containing protein n=1 Tax=Trichogramma kaykai TaxID=54128 RepID=A0ABD2WQL8_9HYME|nr:putative sodium-coupled neutral amino acid transporter 7 [Trichogramma pretiosum]XP_023317679.1 putative sodium-coupled neutral amino acid transporter 7 [Trichogramma pretiosum]